MDFSPHILTCRVLIWHPIIFSGHFPDLSSLHFSNNPSPPCPFLGSSHLLFFSSTDNPSWCFGQFECSYAMDSFPPALHARRQPHFAYSGIYFVLALLSPQSYIWDFIKCKTPFSIPLPICAFRF